MDGCNVLNLSVSIVEVRAVVYGGYVAAHAGTEIVAKPCKKPSVALSSSEAHSFL